MKIDTIFDIGDTVRSKKEKHGIGCIIGWTVTYYIDSGIKFQYCVQFNNSFKYWLDLEDIEKVEVKPA